MLKQYLREHDSVHYPRRGLVKRSGNYFELLGNSVVDNRQTVIDCIPKNRRAFAEQDCVLEHNLNESGWPQNDISALMKATSAAEVDAILMRLNTMKDSGSIPDDVSNEDAIRDYIVPRYVGTSSELLRYMVNKYQTNISSSDLQDVDKIDVQPTSVASDSGTSVSE